MNLIVLEGKYSIFKFPVESALPDWIYSSDFYSITKTKDDLSVVTLQIHSDPGNTFHSKDWRIIKIIGPLDLSMVGVIAEISATLKNVNIPIFIISTYDTDYILVKLTDLERGIMALKENGHNVILEV